MKKRKKSVQKPKKPKLLHKLGDKHFIDGIDCEVRFVNAGNAFICPTTDDNDTPLVARHIAYAIIDDQGEIKRL